MIMIAVDKQEEPVIRLKIFINIYKD